LHSGRNISAVRFLNVLLSAAKIYNLLGQKISKVKDEKDIGVLIDDELSFDKHICEMVIKASSIFAALRRTFCCFFC
jgi:hypothetical protein